MDVFDAGVVVREVMRRYFGDVRRGVPMVCGVGPGIVVWKSPSVIMSVSGYFVAMVCDALV